MLNIKTIDASVLSRMFLAGAKNLEAKKEWINELNVFPVPDGDTGTNMTMTIMSAAAEVSALTDPDMETLAKAISSGSLRGARGNSGVILSQLLRGFTKSVKKAKELDALAVAAAMDRAVETAYKAVMKPKEGTILTVAREAALKAAEIAPEAEELQPFFEKVFAHAEETLARTPEMLPVLKEAGVVDSGGQGLLEVLRGAIDGFLGKEVDYSDFEKTAGPAVTKISPQAEADIKFGYCTEFIILLDKTLPIEEEHKFKEFLTSIGDSIVLVADDEIVKVDVETGRSVPRAYQMEAADQRYFKEYFSSLPPESRVRQCKDMMIHQLDKLNMVDGGDLRAYVNLIVDGMDREQLAAMEKAPLGFAAKIRAKIETLLDQHYKETFFTWLDRGKIVCEPSYRLPTAIHPTSSTAIYGRSLYEAEEDMNALEQDLVKRLTAIPNVLWWHRNIARHGFAINGYFNHYPDIMIMTKSGKIILAETKGEHLKNDDSQEKIELGAAWRNAAGNRYRYYMVFQNEENLPHGAVSMGQFVETVKAL